MKDIVNWIINVSLALTLFSFMYMADYLYRRGLIKHRLIGIRADIIFKEYIRLTRRERGNIGIWFWITLSSFVLTFIFALVYEML